MRLSLQTAAIAALAAFALLAPAAVRPAVAHTTTTYTITDLGANTFPLGINDSGTGVGYVSYPASRNSASYTRAFIWNNSTKTKTEIGTLGGKWSEAWAINNNGQVVGRSLNAAGAQRAFLYENGKMTDLNLVKGNDGKSAAELYPGWTLEAAYGINNNGQIVGIWRHSSQVPGHGNSFRWQKDANGNVSVTAVNLLTRQYQTRGINDDGMAVGSVEHLTPNGDGTNTSTVQASLWQEGIGNTDLGFLAPGGTPVVNSSPIPPTSHAYSINSLSQVVGFSNIQSGSFRAFLWSPGVDGAAGTMIDLGTLGAADRTSLESCAFNHNDAGQVVGWAERNTQYDNDPQFSRAAVWNPDPTAANGMKVQDLNSVSNGGTSWYLKQARDINKNGLIVGNGSLKVKTKLQDHGFLLTPTQ